MGKSAKGKVTSMKTVAMKAAVMKAVATPMKVKKAAMKSKQNPVDKPIDSTKTNAQNPSADGGQDLKSNMDLFRRGELTTGNFSSEEKRCLWNRFHAAKQLNSDAAAKWDATQQEGKK
jgi:hypothetical protein